MIPHKQLNLADIFEDCQNIFEEDKPQFLSLLEEHINLSDYIPLEFYNHFYASTGRSRKYSLTALLWVNQPSIFYIHNMPNIELLFTL